MSSECRGSRCWDRSTPSEFAMRLEDRVSRADGHTDMGLARKVLAHSSRCVIYLSEARARLDRISSGR